MGVRIRNEHHSLSGVQYRVEVVDSDWAGAISTFDDDGFQISWDDESDNFLEPIKASSCTYTMLDDGSGTFSAFRADLASAQENEFQLVVYKYSGSWQLYWVGVIMPDLVEWDNDNDPRRFEIIAKDGLNRLSGLEFDNVYSSPFTTSAQTFMYIIKECLVKNTLASFHSGDYIKVSIDWNEVDQTLAVPQRIFEYVKLWGDVLKNFHDKSEKTVESSDAYDCRFVLESLLKLFCARIIYSDGAYHIQQVSNFITTTYNEADYDSSAAYVTNNTSVSNTSTVDGSTLRILGGGKFGYHPAYKETKLKVKGYLDVRGAYVDNVIVDGTTTTYNKTMNLGTVLGGGSSFATATIAAADNSSGVDINLIAKQIGAGGNSITFTGDGSTVLEILKLNYNNANTNDFTYASTADAAHNLAVIDNAVVVTFSGGVTGTGAANRRLEIDFDLYAVSQLDPAEASNLQIKVDVKLICGSFRIKNLSTAGTYSGYAGCEWSTTSTDKWSYLVKGDDYNTHKVALITPEIPFESEDGCTLELTVTLQRRSVTVPLPDPDLFWGMLNNFRVIAWDADANEISDRVIIVDNPTQTATSVVFDFGDILIGDDPITQNSIISRNYLEVDDGSGVNYRANAWDATFDDDYNLVKTMLFEAMALRKTPCDKYMGSFVGAYSSHKSITYDGSQWVMNQVKLNSKTDEWAGSWFAVTYSQADIIIGSERFTPPAGGIQPYPKIYNPAEKIPIPINPKGKGATPYEKGVYVDAIDVDALDNKHFRNGDSLMVYHPDTRELLQQFVVAADTTVTDTSISVTADYPDYSIPTGALLEHDSKEVVESTNVRSDNFVNLGATWSKVLSIDETDFTTDTYQLDGTNSLVICDVDLTYSYYVDLPLAADSIKNGCGFEVVIKCTDGSLFARVNTSDSGVYIKTSVTSTLTTYSITPGSSLRLVFDGSHWQRISI